VQEALRLIFDLIGRMAERKVSMKQMSGPIEIVRVSGEMVHHRSANDLMEFCNDQPAAWALQSIADSDPRRRLIAMLLVDQSCGATSMRQSRSASTSAIRLPGVVCGHGDLQRVVKMLPGQ